MKNKLFLSIINFLHSHQQPNGSFLSFASPFDSKIKSPLLTTFTTSLILDCLSELADLPETKNIIDPAVNFLLSEKNSDWSWNYWQKDSPENKINPYPNDWDDTACALIALSYYKKELITPEAFGAITKLLVATENNPGGPYYTWMLNEQTTDWKDIDPVVNANIGYFLKLHDINLPPLKKYIEDIIINSNYTSRYYHNPETVLYFITRYYSGPLTKTISDYLLSRQNKDGLWENDLLSTLAISSLIRTKTDPQLFTKAINHLKELASTDTWQTYPLYIEQNKKTIVYNGAPALTTAFALESLTLYEKESQKKPETNTKINISYAAELKKNIVDNVKNYLTFFPEKTIGTTDSLLEKILEKDKGNQITLLPYFFLQTLKPNQSISHEQLITLGEINLYGWLAYTMYDNIMDHDSGPELLPVANTCLRKLIITYKEILPDSAFTLFQELMDNMEKANSWENISCQVSNKIIPKENLIDYPKELLFDKSLPHAFGPITILLSLGYQTDSLEIRQTLSFFKNYLAARQLNDDAHDWQEDLEKGFMNSVSAPLFQAYFHNNPDLKELNLILEKQNLETFFWEKYIITIAGETSEYIKNAETCLSKLKELKLVHDPTYFEKLLAPLKKSAEQITTTKSDINAFFKSFQA